MYRRTAEQTLRQLAAYYPVIAITGPRQSGKTTLSQMVFPDRKYVSLEDLDQRQFAKEDPRGFLAQAEEGLIIDEAQLGPELFSYIQGIVDKSQTPGQFVLTGSQQFGLMSGINQSLAGRVGLVELLPFSVAELGGDIGHLDEALYRGGYPPIYDRKIPPQIWYADYLRTYVERDVRTLIQVKDLSAFQTFLSLCAARAGQLVNFSELGSAAGVDARTVKNWLSVLEASYIVYLLRPYPKSFSKKLVKTPKLYFYDAGLLTHLLRLRPEDLPLSPFRGRLFETMVIGECLKANFNQRRNLDFYFWRDNKGVEVDLLVQDGPKVTAIEIKSGATVQSSWFQNLGKLKDYAAKELSQTAVVYGGDQPQPRQAGQVVPWRQVADFL